MEKCIWHIQESSKVVQNLQLLQQLIQTFPRTTKTWWGSDTTQKPNTQAGVIERLERDYAIIDHLLQDLAFYKGMIMSMMQSGDDDTTTKKAPESEANDGAQDGVVKKKKKKKMVQTLRVDDSSFGYLEQIKIRQDFLLFLLTHSGLRLTRAQYRRIWDHLVGGALCREEMDLCYIWLLRGSIPPHFSSSNDSHYRLYNQQDQRYLFENCIRRLPAAHLSETGYLLVVSFFCSVNKRAGTLSIKGEKKKLPRRAGDGQGIKQITSGNGIKAKISNTLNGNNNKKNKDGDDEEDDVSKSPTRKAREHLEKFVKNINTDLLNEDGTYLIDPDDHYISAKRLRVIDYDGLDGLTYFWDIVLKAVLPSVGLQAIELLNALHFYFAPRIKSKDRDDIRQQHVQKCLIYLDQALKSDQNKDKNRIIVKRMIMLLKQFLESFVSQLEGTDNQNTIEIEIHPDKEFRVKNYIQKCKLTENFGQLRKKILNKLSELNCGLIVEHLIIKWNDKYTITQQEHDRFRLSKLDWSQSRVLEIKRVRYAFTRYFWNVPQSQQPIADAYPYPIESSLPIPPQQKLMSGFKRVNALQIFSQDENIYNQLFPLLQRKQIGPAVWDILNLLPPSHIRVRRIIDLGFESKFIPKRWNEIFDLKKPYQLLYYLQILCSIFSGEEWKKEYFNGNRMRQRAQISHLEWIQRFINLGGFSFITQLLFKIDLSNNQQGQNNPNKIEEEKEQRRINVNCVAFLFQIVSLLLSMDKTFKSVISSPKNVKDGSITNFKDFPYIEGKLIQTALNISQKILLWSDLAAKQKQEELEEKQQADSRNKHNIQESIDDVRGHLKIRRQVSDFSNLTDVTDLGPNGATILVECLQIMIGCIRTNPKYVEALFEMEHLTEWLKSLLLNTQYPETRPAVSVALQMLSRVQLNSDSSDKTKAGPIKLLNELIKIFQSPRSQTQNCHEFFELLLHVFDHVCRVYKHSDSSLLLKCKTIAKEAFNALKKYSSLEKYQEPENVDEYLVGIINLIRISAHHQLYENNQDDDDDTVLKLCEYVFYDCLFNVPQQGDYGAKCKAAHSRRIAYSLLHKLNEKYPNSLSLVESIILRDPIWYHVGKQSLNKASWHYHPSDLERFPVRYVGLKNQGATCYMNSLVQQLFIVDDFRKAILSARVDNENNDENNEEQQQEQDTENKQIGLRSKDSVLYQIQLLFGYLMKSQKKYYDTMPLCKVLKGFDGQPLPVGEQQDVNEFCARLFDQLENNLKGTNCEKCIDTAFGGTLMNQMIAQEECTCKSEREEPFHTVSLTVKNKSSLKESLELYVKGDILDGDNKWLCGKCDEKRAALKRSCFGKLSKYLILHLSRFEFDFNTMRRKKLNTRFEFPQTLNMEKYTREGLARAEKEKAAEKAAKAKAKEEKKRKKKDDQIKDEDEDKDEDKEAEEDEETEEEEKKIPKDEEPELPTYPQEYYEYRLVGVVVHTGGAEAGHYYSYAQSSDGKWWEFNDVDVLPFDPNDLDKETFGGKHWVTIDDPKEKGKKVRKEVDKPYNAYMLIYKQVLAQETEDKQLQTFEQEEQALTLPPPIQQTIWSENLKFLCDKNVFDFDYLTFLWQTIQLASLRSFAISSNSPSITSSPSQSQTITVNKEEEKSDPSLQVSQLSSYSDGLLAIQIATCFVFEILIRAKDNGTFPRWMRQLYKMYQQSEIGRKWFLNKVSTQQQWFINTMFHNAHKPARLAFGDLLLAIIHYQSVNDRKYYDEFTENVSSDDIKDDTQYVDENDNDDDNEKKNQYLNWPQIEISSNDSSSIRGMGDIINGLNNDRFSVARFIVCMFRFLHLVPKFHRSYEQFFKLLKGIAHVSWYERKLLINLGVIRSVVAFYLNDSPILHFNRQVVGRNDQGQRQTRRISPPRVHDVIKLLSVLVRSASTATFPPQPKKKKPSPQQMMNVNNDLPDDEPDLPPEEDEEENNDNNDNANSTNNPTDVADETTKIEVSLSIKKNAALNDETKQDKDEQSEDMYYEQEFEPKSLDFGFAPFFITLNNGRGRGILLPDDDKRCIWNGLDTTLGKNFNECEPWDVPSTIDPLPTYSEYNRFVEQQQAITSYKKKHGKDCKLPPNLQMIADNIEKRKNLMLAPRKLTNVNIIDWLFKDRSGPGNSCLYQKECIEIIIYSCFNNWILSDMMFEWLYRKVAEEFKASHEYGPYLKCIEELLLTKDINFQKKMETFLPKIIQLFKRCSKTDDTGTDLLLFQLTSFLVRMSFKNETMAAIIRQDEGLLDECMEEYRHNHSHHYQVSNQYGGPHSGGPMGGNRSGYNMNRGGGNGSNNNNNGGGGGGGGGNNNNDGSGKKSMIKGFNMRRQ